MSCFEFLWNKVRRYLRNDFRQECIPVGCVPSATVAVSRGGGVRGVSAPGSRGGGGGRFGEGCCRRLFWSTSTPICDHPVFDHLPSRTTYFIFLNIENQFFPTAGEGNVFKSVCQSFCPGGLGGWSLSLQRSVRILLECMYVVNVKKESTVHFGRHSMFLTMTNSDFIG